MGDLLQNMVSAGFLQSVVVGATPLIIGGLGELVIERAGTLNLSIAGMFPLAGATAFVVSYKLGGGAGAMLLGFLAGAGSGVAVAMLLGAVCGGLRGNQITVGLALFVFSLGGATMLYRLAVGTSTATKRVPILPELRIPGLASIPYIGRVFFSQSVLVYAAFLLTPIVAYILFRTPVGLRLRAVGENPRCVDGLGMSISRLRYGALAVGGALIGVAGASFPLGQLGTFDATTLTGEGWLALMLVIFGKWRPVRLFLGALLFAYVLGLQFVVALSLPSVPSDVLLVLPYVIAVAVLIRTSQRGDAPAALTRPFDREARV